MSVVRTIHNRENPYVQLNKAALWDKELPLECVGLWARCLSKPSGWVFYLSELAASCKINVQTIRKYINKLIACGYAIRQKNRDEEKGRFGGYDYTFFEFKLTDEERAEYLPELKKCLPQTKKPCTVTPSPVDPLLLNKESSSLRSEEDIEKKEEKSAPPPASADAERLCSIFLQKIKERQPNFKQPNMKEWVKDFDLMLRVDKRRPEEVEALIGWWSTSWWKGKCLCPQKFRQKFDTMHSQFMDSPEQTPAEINKKFALNSRKDLIDFKIENNFIKYTKWYQEDVTKPTTFQDHKLSLDMPHEEFRELLMKRLSRD